MAALRVKATTPHVWQDCEMPAITEKHIDASYTILETLNVCQAILARGDVSEGEAGSISWLVGQIMDWERDNLTLMERIRDVQFVKAQIAQQAA